jgi:hypothetical protein
MNDWNAAINLINFLKPGWRNWYSPGEANAPTLYDFDINGYITGPSGGRVAMPMLVKVRGILWHEFNTKI